MTQLLHRLVAHTINAALPKTGKYNIIVLSNNQNLIKPKEGITFYSFSKLNNVVHMENNQIPSYVEFDFVLHDKDFEPQAMEIGKLLGLKYGEKFSES